MSQSSLRKWVWSWSRDFVRETKTAEIINSRITVITDPEPISLWLSWPSLSPAPSFSLSLSRPPTVNPLILADHSCARTLALTNTRALLYLSLLPGPAWPWRQDRRAQPCETPSRKLQPCGKDGCSWLIFFRVSLAHSRFPAFPFPSCFSRLGIPATKVANI